DAAIDDVGGEFGRGALERDLHRFDDLVERLDERVADLFVGDDHRLGHAGDQIAALDFHRLDFVARIGGADRDLDQLGAPLAAQQLVFALDKLRDRLVHFVAADADRAGKDDAGQRDDGDFGGAAADVDDHAARRLGDRQARADGGGHRLLDQIDLARSGG